MQDPDTGKRGSREWKRKGVAAGDKPGFGRRPWGASLYVCSCMSPSRPSPVEPPPPPLFPAKEAAPVIVFNQLSPHLFAWDVNIKVGVWAFRLGEVGSEGLCLGWVGSWLNRCHGVFGAFGWYRSTECLFQLLELIHALWGWLLVTGSSILASGLEVVLERLDSWSNFARQMPKVVLQLKPHI